MVPSLKAYFVWRDICLCISIRNVSTCEFFIAFYHGRQKKLPVKGCDDKPTSNIDKYGTKPH